LSEGGAVTAETVAKAIQKYQLQADKINPLHA
jgi:pyruvate dehydrogenase complex dehydrogenase (E1) component